MDIISAHQQGLLEQLADEVADLAGASRDFGQRAVVLHHLYDHSREANGWALAEARRNLLVAAQLALLQRKAERWTLRGRDRAERRERLEALKAAIGDRMRARAAAAYRAYRLSATAALRDAAEVEIPRSLLGQLDQCHSARRLGDSPSAGFRQVFDSAMEDHVASVAGVPGDAWSAVERSLERELRKGFQRLERLVLSDPSLPAAFRANPAQHFYALLSLLGEKRKSEWRKACDLTPDAVAIAA